PLAVRCVDKQTPKTYSGSPGPTTTATASTATTFGRRRTRCARRRRWRRSRAPAICSCTGRRAWRAHERGGPRNGPPGSSNEGSYAPLGLPRPARPSISAARGGDRHRLVDRRAPLGVALVDPAHEIHVGT